MTQQSGGVGIFGILTVIFIWLKLNPGGHFDTPVQDWSWWLVLVFPLIGVIIAAVALTILLFIWYYDNKDS